MQIFKRESAAFKAGGDCAEQSNRLCTFANIGFRVLKCDGGFKVLMVPDFRWDRHATPFYI
jgi:hypothetical protein